MRTVFLVACIVAGATFLLERQSRAAADTLFGNETYFTSCPYIAEQVTLINGEGVVRNGLLNVSLYYEGHYVYGDFNHDGLRDAAVTIGEGQGGSDDRISLAFLINDGTRLVHRQSVYLDDSATVRSLRVRDHAVIVDMLIHQDGDCHAGPTKHVSMAYVYGGPDRKVDGTGVAREKAIGNYVNSVSAYELEFAQKSLANKHLKQKTVREARNRCTEGHWVTIDDRPVFICA